MIAQFLTKSLSTGGVSIFIDKMTANTTSVPAVWPHPKCMNSAHRLPIHLTGVVVHNIGYFVYKSYASSSAGCNLTTEVLYRLLAYLQDVGYRFTDELRIQADNHTDNKTPAVLFFLGWLLRTRVFSSKAKLPFLEPGHGHTEGDQKKSVSSRSIHRRDSHCISESRLDLAVRNGLRRSATSRRYSR